MTNKAKIIVGVGVAVVLIAIVVMSIRSKTPRGIQVRTAKVERKELLSIVTSNGTVQARTKVDISANIMGQITKLNIEEGQTVKKGDLLLVIDQKRYAAAVEGSRANLEALQADLARMREAAAQARRDLQRTEAQQREGIVAAADLDRARSIYDQAIAGATRVERQIEQARADVISTRDGLDKTEIRAPMDGVVTRRNVEQGEVVVTGTMNNAGTVLMTISDMSTIEAVLEVDQTDVPQLRIGQTAEVRIDAFPDQTFPGTVSEIGSSPIRGQSALGGAATGTDYEVKVTLNRHPERIRPGLTVTADITTASVRGVLAVPIGALVLRQPETKSTPGAAGKIPTPTPEPGKPESVASRVREIEGIYVVAKEKAEFRPVKTGVRGELDIEIVEGVKEGEEIVIGPFRALRDLKPGGDVNVNNKESTGPPA